MHRRHPLLLVTALSALLLAGRVQAQGYPSSGPGGVSYSDQPPPAQAGRQVAPLGGDTRRSGSATLPYTLSQTVQRFPVTLYTSADCPPCVSGRNLLIQRGVPFSEKTVQSNEDIAALQRLAGASQVPVLTIGGQRLSGYSDQEWSQYLDAAGYPKPRRLRGPYRPRPAPPRGAQTPVPAAATGTAREATAPAAATPAEPSIAPPRNATNPAGIRF